MKKRILLALAGLLYLGFFLLPFQSDIKVRALAALVIIQILWVGNVFPLAYSSLLVMLLFSFHFLSYEETLSYMGSDVVWLLFAMFVMSRAFIDTGLADRLSLSILKGSRGASKALIFISFVLSFVLSILVPSNVGKAGLLASVLDSLVRSLKAVNSVSNLGKSLFIGITYLIPITGAFIATGASSTIYAYSLFSEIGPSIHYLEWVLLFGVPILVFSGLLWLVFILMFPPEQINKEHLLLLIDEKMGELGKMSLREKKMLGIMGVTLILWVFQNVHGYSIPLIGLLGACLTVFPGIGVWKWEQARKAVNWDIVLFFASTLMVSGMLLGTGTIDWLAGYLNSFLAGQSPLMIVLILIVLTALMRIMFVNVLGFLAIMLPIAISLGDTLIGVSALTLAKAVFLAGIPGFFFITQSPVHITSYPYGHFTEKDLFRAGVVSALLWIGVILGSFLVYW
ncbi:citrate/succinate antiporter [Mesobacillus campisalis]|uniref:Sodium-dependent dicarboxylate transporter SdcS n=1 Tax=Mesobacillus campisalis TaxID=1408103 RepID=A0A0M2T0X5_9BACI|nr:SLC13 family permease [Mesobacillus campisalis]KKK38882.1 citrate/succinate antiporter [Mesobacillus campisalis]